MSAGNHSRGSTSAKGTEDLLGNFWHAQPPLARWSYALGAIGAMLAVHDFHHPKDTFGLSTLPLGAAILMYLLSLRRSH